MPTTDILPCHIVNMTDGWSAPDSALSGSVNQAPAFDAGRVRRFRSPLARFIVRRLATALLTLVVVSMIIFGATDLIPGSPAASILGKFATRSELGVLDKRLGFDKPLTTRYVDWVGGLVQGSLGNSAVGLAQGERSAPIWPLIRGRLANTFTLTLLTALLVIPLALLLGSLAAIRFDRPLDHTISTVTLTLIAMPEFVVGSLLILLFFVLLHWLDPTSLIPPGSPAIKHVGLLILPVLTLLATSVGWATRLVRAGMIEALQSDYVTAARLNGVAEWTVIRRYALRNALAPSVQVFAITVQALFGGIVVVETIFSYPGLGQALVTAVMSHDSTLVESVAMLIAAFYIAINVAADFIVLLLVPKLRTRS